MAAASYTPEDDRIVVGAIRRSRFTAAIALIGIVAVIASLATLYVIASNRAELAEQREAVARENARTIADPARANPLGLRPRRRSSGRRRARNRRDQGGGPHAKSGRGHRRRLRQCFRQGSAADRDGAPKHRRWRAGGRFPACRLHPFCGQPDASAGYRAQSRAPERRLGRSGGQRREIPTADGLNEVRYSGDNEAAASALAQAINQAAITSAPVRARKLDMIRPKVLEVWISG